MSALTKVVLDLETNGLDEHEGVILEVGAVGLDAEFNEIFRVSTPIALPPMMDLQDLLASMPEEVVLMHSENGLISDLHHNSAKLAHPLTTMRDEDSGEYLLPSIDEADNALAELLDQHSEEKIILAGSGVSHFDFRWLKRHMPLTACRLWHGTCDVGVMRRFYKDIIGEDLTDVDLQKTHRALDDVDCHIEELKAFAGLFIRDRHIADQIGAMAGNFGLVQHPSMDESISTEEPSL